MHMPHTHKQQACMHAWRALALSPCLCHCTLFAALRLSRIRFVFCCAGPIFFFTSDERMSTIRCYSIVMWLEWNAFSLSDVGSVAIFRPFSASSSSSQMQWIVMLCCWYPMRYMFGLLLVLCAGDRIIIWFFLLRMFDIHANYVLSFSRPLSHTHRDRLSFSPSPSTSYALLSLCSVYVRLRCFNRIYIYIYSSLVVSFVLICWPYRSTERRLSVIVPARSSAVKWLCRFIFFFFVSHGVDLVSSTAASVSALH